jgi:biotin carboxyl carrier protein
VKKFRIIVGSKSYNVEVGDPHQLPVTVIVDGETFSVDVQPVEDTGPPAAAPDHPPAPGPTDPTAEGSSQVTAPMPGTILDIAVQPGDRVQHGQVLCALEAMKMKSPIRALRAGTVRQMQVHEGQTVDHGDLLFVVD